MAAKHPVPDDIKRYKPRKCTKVRNDGGIYRVYKYKAKKLPSGKWGTDSGYLIGKIIPEQGFVPNKRYLRELAEQQASEEASTSITFPEGITDVCYGQYALLMFLSQDVCAKLKMYFPLEKAMQIYCET